MTHGGPESRWSSAERRREEVKCAYCGGRGVDPFGLPGPESRCSVCGGKGHNRVMTPYIRCDACGGTGRQLGRRLTCSACKGRGVTTIRRPTVTCPRCQGSGVQPGNEFGLPCTLCSGLGAVERESRAAPPASGMSGRSADEGGRPSLADRVSAYVTSSPGAGLGDVQVLFGLSKSEAERTLQGLVRARKIKKKEELYHPA